MSETIKNLVEAGKKIAAQEAAKTQAPAPNEAATAPTQAVTVATPEPTAIVTPPTAPPENATVTPTPAPTQTNWDEISDEKLAELAAKRGFKKDDSIPESDAEKATRLQREEGDFAAYAIGQLGLKPEDLSKPSFLKQKEKVDLVYDDYADKQKELNPKLSDETIRRRFNNEYGILEIDEFSLSETEIENLKSDRDDGMKRLNKAAEKIIKKAENPILDARSNFDEVKKEQQIIRKVGQEVDIFAKQLGNEFIYKDEDGTDIPIEFPSPEYKNQLIENLKQAYFYATLNNPKGTFDVSQVANNQMRFDLNKQIVGVVKANAYQKGLSEGKKPFKNPMTNISSGELPTSDAETKKAGIIKAAMQTRTNLANHG